MVHLLTSGTLQDNAGWCLSSWLLQDVQALTEETKGRPLESLNHWGGWSVLQSPSLKSGGMWGTRKESDRKATGMEQTQMAPVGLHGRGRTLWSGAQFAPRNFCGKRKKKKKLS